MSSLYTAQLRDDAPAAARESLGTAVQASERVADAAREAFVHAMSRASIIVALVVALGALIALRYLPARELEQQGAAPGSTDPVLATLSS